MLALAASVAGAHADDPTITIDAGNPVGKVSPLLYGLMTEEINHCYDGGLYAELVQNRAFLDDPRTPVRWSVLPGGATITLDTNQPVNSALPVSLRLDAQTAPAGIANEGYWGIPVQPNTTYHASFFAKAAPGFSGPVTVAIQSDDGATTYAQAVSQPLTAGWTQYAVTLQTGNCTSTDKARLVLTIQKPGTVWFSLVSLFPPTWNNQPNGFRKDLMQMLVDMKPRFLRLPGGNYLEGDTIDKRFQFKNTIGPISQRAGHQGPWGYRSTDGLGMLEFLRWCEDMGAEPVLAVYAGYSLGGMHVNPGSDLDPYVQDALDEIEYVTGPVTSKWGAQRAKDGHPAPFKLHYVEIGNEDWFDRTHSYDARFAQFYDAIKDHYPQLLCISTVGNEQPAEKRVSSRKPDAVDEHYYRRYTEFIQDSPTHFEKYDRNGPRVFVGEWASYETEFVPWDSRTKALNILPTPNMNAALGDAALMAAMERNSDIVVMNCYAPLFVNINQGAYQWRPDLIGYDALHCYGSPSYYAITMFSRNIGDQLLKVSTADTAVQACATRDSATGTLIIKLVNPQSTEEKVKLDIQGAQSVAPTADALTLAAEPDATNSIDEPRKVVPVSSQVSGVRPTFTYSAPANSITVLGIKSR